MDRDLPYPFIDLRLIALSLLVRATRLGPRYLPLRFVQTMMAVTAREA